MCRITKFDSIIVRFGGEIGIKSEWTRRHYERLLSNNIKKTFEHHKIDYDEIVRKRGRIYIKTTNKKAALKLTHVFGISSVSPAVETTSDLNHIVELSLKMAAATIRKSSSFAIRCNRVGTHTYSSMDVCKEVGKQVLAELENRHVHVDLTNPKHTIYIEVREDEAYVFTDILKGPKGFPVGSQGKIICLLSGGFDSPVACWLAMRRGCTILPVYFDSSPTGDESGMKRVRDIARKLFGWSLGYPRRMYIVPHGKSLETFIKEAPRKFTCLLCKRMMYRLAERIAEIEKADGIVTGEAIGEQASQTTVNLGVLNEVAKNYPIHRPLLGFDKTETIELAKKIRTYDISARKAKECSAAPDKPSTMAKLESVKDAEQRLSVEHLIEESIRGAKIITL